MKLIINISEYDREWIKNTYGIPQDIDVTIARAIINGKALHDKHGELIDRGKLLRDIEHYHLSDGKFQHWVEVQNTIVEAEGEE